MRLGTASLRERRDLLGRTNEGSAGHRQISSPRRVPARAVAPLLRALALISLSPTMRVRIAPWTVALALTAHALPSSAEAAQPPTLASSSQSVAATSHAGVGPQVFFRTNRAEATLERRAGSVDWIEGSGSPSGTASLWTRLCTAPCQTTIHPDDELRIAGEGIAPSQSFRIDPSSHAVQIDADAGSQSTLSWGKTFVSTGVGLLALGTVLIAIPAPGDDPATTNAFDTLRTIGYGSLGAGGVMTLIGIPLWISGGTTVTVSHGAPPIAQAPSAILVGAHGQLQ